MTSSVTSPSDSRRLFPIGGPLEPSLTPLSLTVSEIFIGEWRMWCNGGYDLKRPLNKGQGHSFWYQSISNNTTNNRLSIVTFGLGRIV